VGPDADTFCGSHSGYERLSEPVTPVRRLCLDHQHHRLQVHDAFEGVGRHRIEIPLHLAPRVAASERTRGRVLLRAGSRSFSLDWGPTDAWTLTIGQGRVSPSYGVAVSTVRLVWAREGMLETALTVRIAPGDKA
jgi:hypothetical protein